MKLGRSVPPPSSWPWMFALLPVAAGVLLVDGLVALMHKLRRAESEALADWNHVLSGVVPNATIDKLIEEEDSAST